MTVCGGQGKLSLLYAPGYAKGKAKIPSKAPHQALAPLSQLFRPVLERAAAPLSLHEELQYLSGCVEITGQSKERSYFS